MRLEVEPILSLPPFLPPRFDAEGLLERSRWFPTAQIKNGCEAFYGPNSALS